MCFGGSCTGLPKYGTSQQRNGSQLLAHLGWAAAGGGAALLPLAHSTLLTLHSSLRGAPAPCSLLTTSHLSPPDYFSSLSSPCPVAAAALPVPPLSLCILLWGIDIWWRSGAGGVPRGRCSVKPPHQCDGCGARLSAGFLQRLSPSFLQRLSPASLLLQRLAPSSSNA